ncbi:MAG: PD-(D/E)XK nuclease family protein, partial [Lentimicrobiaceae bacterium]
AMEENESGLAKRVERAKAVNESGLVKRVENTNEVNEPGLVNRVENTNEVNESGLAKGVGRAKEANESGLAKRVERANEANESGLAKRVERAKAVNESGLANGVENTNEVKELGLAFIVNKTGKTGFEGKNDSADKVPKSDIDDMADTDLEILYCLYQKVNDLKNCLEREDIQIESLLTLYNFFREIAGSTRVPFYGEPLQGIQVMGMLETRVLDFENIILLSANEDVLPSAKSNKSFIPFDIRKHFNLPTHQERQAVFAYHFYKLLQRSSQAWLVYNEDDSGLGGGEKSRYIRQLEWELPGKGVNLIPLTPSADDAEGTKPWEISIEKTDTVLQKLAEKADKGFSFSSIKQYINCPLSFYFSYILGIEEIEEVEEDISVRTMGTIIHAVLEELYKDSVNTFPDINKLKEAAKNAQTLIAGSTKDTYPALKIDSGKNLLFLKVAETWLKRFLESEIRLIEKDKAPVIMGIEHPLLRKITIDLPGNITREVTLYGKLDRIDVSQGNLRVIDYKTGAVDAKDLVVKSVDEMFDPDKKFDKKLQLSFYKFIAESDATFSKYKICPGIISFRSLSKGFLELDSQVDDDTFELRLKELLNDMFNPGKKFTQTELKNCKYCNFQQICHRIIKNNF